MAPLSKKRQRDDDGSDDMDVNRKIARLETSVAMMDYDHDQENHLTAEDETAPWDYLAARLQHVRLNLYPPKPTVEDATGKLTKLSPLMQRCFWTTVHDIGIDLDGGLALFEDPIARDSLVWNI